MFASNFIVKNDALTHERGQEKLTKFVKEEGIWSGGTMASHFCSVCGSLMYRIGSSYPGVTILRLGQVDDLGLVETTLRPSVEQYGKDRVEVSDEVLSVVGGCVVRCSCWIMISMGEGS